MKIAIINLPHLTLPGGNCFNTLHGYWVPPFFVISFWSTGCIVRYINEENYENKKEIVLQSQMNSYKQFYKDNAL